MSEKILRGLNFPGLEGTYMIPQVDATLSASGASADAKVVGDELATIKKMIAFRYTDVTNLTISQYTSNTLSQWSTISYSNEIENIDGVVTLVNPSTVLVDSVADANILKGKYITNIATISNYIAENGVYKISEDAIFTLEDTSNSTVTIKNINVNKAKLAEVNDGIVGGGISKDTLIVEVTGATTDNLSASHTYEEISNAVENGRDVVVHVTDSGLSFILPLIYIFDDSGFSFGASLKITEIDSKLAYIHVSINSANQVVLFSQFYNDTDVEDGESESEVLIVKVSGNPSTSSHSIAEVENAIRNGKIVVCEYFQKQFLLMDIDDTSMTFGGLNYIWNDGGFYTNDYITIKIDKDQNAVINFNESICIPSPATEVTNSAVLKMSSEGPYWDENDISGSEIPFFDLTEMGLPDVPLNGFVVRCECDTTELLDAIENGSVKLRINGTIDDSPIIMFQPIVNFQSADIPNWPYQAVGFAYFNDISCIFRIQVWDDSISASFNIVNLLENREFELFNNTVTSSLVNLGGMSAFGALAQYSMELGAIPPMVNVTLDGVEYRYLPVTKVTGLGDCAGNLSMLNPMGFNFPDTGEPFIVGIGTDSALLSTDLTQSKTNDFRLSVIYENRINHIKPEYLASNPEHGKILSIGQNGLEWTEITSNNESSVIPVPTEEDYGKALTATSEGFVWDNNEEVVYVTFTKDDNGNYTCSHTTEQIQEAYNANKTIVGVEHDVIQGVNITFFSQIKQIATDTVGACLIWFYAMVPVESGNDFIGVASKTYEVGKGKDGYYCTVQEGHGLTIPATALDAPEGYVLAKGQYSDDFEFVDPASLGSFTSAENLFIVTIDYNTKIASHSESEIKAAKESGKVVVTMDRYGMLMPLYDVDSGCFESIYRSDSNTLQYERYTVAEDKSVTIEQGEVNDDFLITVDGVNETCDKTYEEVKAAMESGKDINVQLMRGSVGEMLFNPTVMVLKDNNDNDVGIMMSVIYHSDTSKREATSAVIGLHPNGGFQMIAGTTSFPPPASGVADGKVLMTQDGNTVWADVPASGTGVAIPVPTEADFGKVLKATPDGLIWSFNNDANAFSASGVKF